MGGYLFDQHKEVIKQMWLEVFEAAITTNAFLAEEMWTDSVNPSKQREMELALRYFDEKYQPLRMVIEKVSVKPIVVDIKPIVVDSEDLSSDKKSKSSESLVRKQTSCGPFDCLQLDLSDNSVLNVGAVTTDNYLRDKKSKRKETLNQTFKDNKGSINCEPLLNQHVSSSIPQEDNAREFCDIKCDVWSQDQTHKKSESPSFEYLQEVENTSEIYMSGFPTEVMRGSGKRRRKKEHEAKNSKLSLERHRPKINESSSVASTRRNNDCGKNVVSDQEAKLIKISLDNLRSHLCVAPTSSFDIIHSCPNNFEKLKYLRIKERESPSVRISCAFQQGYYLELLFPGRRIQNNAGNNNYLQRLFELNMSLSYCRQLRQFFKTFRRYRRLLHLNVPLRNILRNISRIKEKIENSEEEKQFWSMLPTNTIRSFYECYGYWFGLAIYDVYSLFDVVDNYPAGTVDQFLDTKCTRIYVCESYIKAVKWLNSVADKKKYLLAYKTVDYVHCVVAERESSSWTYEVSFDKYKNNIIFVGIYIFIKSH